MLSLGQSFSEYVYLEQSSLCMFFVFFLFSFLHIPSLPVQAGSSRTTSCPPRVAPRSSVSKRLCLDRTTPQSRPCVWAKPRPTRPQLSLFYPAESKSLQTDTTLSQFCHAFTFDILILDSLQRVSHIASRSPVSVIFRSCPVKTFSLQRREIPDLLHQHMERDCQPPGSQ